MRGRKPTPTQLKLLNGTRKDRINDSEPALKRAKLRCPSWLSDRAKKIWRETYAVLDEALVVTLGDGRVLAHFAVACATVEEAEEIVAKEGQVIESGPHNVKKQNPAVLIQQTAIKVAAQLGALLGLDPANRSRLKVARPKTAGVRSRDRAAGE